MPSSGLDSVRWCSRWARRLASSMSTGFSTAPCPRRFVGRTIMNTARMRRIQATSDDTYDRVHKKYAKLLSSCVDDLRQQRYDGFRRWFEFEYRIPPLLGMTIGIWDFFFSSPPFKRILLPSRHRCRIFGLCLVLRECLMILA